MFGGNLASSQGKYSKRRTRTKRGSIHLSSLGSFSSAPKCCARKLTMKCKVGKVRASADYGDNGLRWPSTSECMCTFSFRSGRWCGGRRKVQQTQNEVHFYYAICRVMTRMREVLARGKPGFCRAWKFRDQMRKLRFHLANLNFYM